MTTELHPATISLPVSKEISTTESPDPSPQNSSTQFDLYQSYLAIADRIKDIGGPVVFTVGVFGNLMTILIIHRLPTSTSSALFLILSISDQWVLVIEPLDHTLFRYYGVILFRDRSPWHCWLTHIVLRTASSLSSWMLVSLTMLRAASVLWPLRVGAVWTQTKTAVTTCIMVIFFTLFSCHLKKHYVIDEYCDMLGLIKPLLWIRQFQTQVLPFMVLVVNNSVLVWSLVTFLRMRNVCPSQQAIQDPRQQKVSSLTVTLIAASLRFFLLTTPITIALQIYVGEYVDESDPIQKGQYWVFHDASHFLWYCNSAVNLYLYCVTDRKFRAELLNIAIEVYGLCRKSKKCGY